MYRLAEDDHQHTPSLSTDQHFRLRVQSLQHKIPHLHLFSHGVAFSEEVEEIKAVLQQVLELNREIRQQHQDMKVELNDLRSAQKSHHQKLRAAAVLLAEDNVKERSLAVE